MGDDPHHQRIPPSSPARWRSAGSPPVTGRSPTCTSSRSRSSGHPGRAPLLRVPLRPALLAILVLPVCLAMLAYAATVPSEIDPLVPALQNSLLLSVHVARRDRGVRRVRAVVRGGGCSSCSTGRTGSPGCRDGRCSTRSATRP